MGFLTRYYEARCGWMTVAVGCQLGSQLGYPGHLANPPDGYGRPAEALATKEMQAA